MSVSSKISKVLGLLPTATLACSIGAAHAATVPAPVYDETLTTHEQAKPSSIVFAGGCFWGVQAVFQHVKGVTEAVSGYAGGDAHRATYDAVSTGSTGHAESVKVTYDPSQVTAGRLMQVFFSVAHDPTEVNRQGPDRGTQYRSAIFTSSDEQKKIADAYIKQLDAAKIFSDPIATQVQPLNGFYPAEAYHQNYATLHPDNPYIAINDAPKVADLQKKFPDLYVQN